MASEAVEVSRTDAVVERRLGCVFTRATVVTGVGITGTVSGILTLRPGKGWRTQTLRTLATGDAGASITAVEAATCLSIIITRGPSKALQENPENANILYLYANRKHQSACYQRRKHAYRRTFADEAVWGVTGNSTGPSVPTPRSLTSIKHSVTVLTCGEINSRYEE